MVACKPQATTKHVSIYRQRNLGIYIVKIILLWLILASNSCYCSNPHATFLIVDQADHITLAVDKPVLLGNDKTFYLTIKNKRNKPIKLQNYQIRVTTNQADTNSSKIYYACAGGAKNYLPINSPMGNRLTIFSNAEKLSPGKELCLPAFTIQTKEDIKKLQLTFELWKENGEQPTAIQNNKEAILAQQDIVWNRSALDLAGLYNFTNDQITFDLINNGKPMNSQHIQVYATSTEAMEITLNGQKVDHSGISLAKILQGDDRKVIKTKQALTLGIHHTTDKKPAAITLTFRDQDNELLINQTVNWGVSPEMVTYLQQQNPFIGSILTRLKKGQTLQRIKQSSFVKNNLDNFRTLLHTLIALDQKDMASDLLNIFLEKGADIEAKDTSQRTPLHAAASAGHLGIVKRLLAANASIEAEDMDHRKPLHHAALQGHTAIVQLLLEKGCSINEKDKYGTTALGHAVHHGHVAIVKMLQTRGAT